MNITIRRAQISETDDLTALCMRSKQSNGYDDAFMQACREELTVTADRLSDGEYWVAHAAVNSSQSDAPAHRTKLTDVNNTHSIQSIIVGCACLVVDSAAKTGEIHAFFVDPEWQRHGIGSRLWQTLVNRSKQCAITTLTLDADPFAVPFYTSLGFAVTGEIPSGSIPGRSLPVMSLDLADISHEHP